jgi:hypothetical protein
MYTATSRAVDFLYVGYIDNNKNITDLNLISKLDKVKTSKDSNFDSSIKELQEKLVILKQFDLSISEQEEEEDQDDREDEEEQEDTDTPNPQPTPPTTPTSPTSGVVETKEEEPEAIPDETITEEDVEDIEIVEEEEPTTGNTFQHKVTTDDNIGNPPASSNKFSIPIGAPSHDSFYEVTDPNTGEVVFKGIKALTPTDPVYIVKANTRERDAENKPAGFLVVTPTKKNGLYSLLGILTEAEQELHKEKLVDSAPIIYTRDNSYPDADSLVNIPIDLDNSNSITVTLDQDATTPITYNYVSRNSISPEFKPFSIARKFVDNLNSPTVVITEDGEKVQISPDSQLEVNPSTAVRIGIASKTSVPKGVKRFIPSLGHPIMLISNIVRKVGVISSNMADQVIILTPKLLNKNNKFHYEKFIKPIEDFVSSVEKMHEKLAGLNIGPEFRLGYKTTANNSTNHFSKLIANLADLYYYKNNGKELKDETYNKAYSYLEKLFGKDLRTDNSLDSLLELAVEIDTQVHGKYAEKRVRLGKGDSQKAFNAIARSNLWVLDADNPNQALVIRDAKTVETEGTKEKFERGKSKGKTVAISGRNLLGRITDYKGDFTIGNTMDPEVKKYVGRTNASYLKRTGQV